jgi:hypothetical protein
MKAYEDLARLKVDQALRDGLIAQQVRRARSLEQAPSATAPSGLEYGNERPAWLVLRVARPMMDAIGRALTAVGAWWGRRSPEATDRIYSGAMSVTPSPGRARGDADF